ncbi:substrate-binding domain-containing protein [Paenibacillus sp. GCM10027626]|uniref:substrate-binding domain-containing protein n=1 Tax=Paenibacillus sp. GCM10027626 TaxID=3273411 RepID=UPI00362FF1DB
MKKIILTALVAGSAAALLLFVHITWQALQGYSVIVPRQEVSLQTNGSRLVFISGDAGSPFWHEVRKGVAGAAAKQGIAIDFREPFPASSSEYLKQMDMSIAAKVDGIIVQGEDTPEFVQMVSKASQKGIPVITVVTDAPDSLRKTYVGADHFREGVTLGERIATDLKGTGMVAIVNGSKAANFQQLRKQGLKEAFAKHPDMELKKIAYKEVKGNLSDYETNELLNQYPECRTFIGLTAEAGSSIMKIVKTRGRLQDFAIYVFDESPEMTKGLQDGLISAMLQQHPQQIGAKSVQLLLDWLEGRTVPLALNYYTPVKMMTRGEQR